MSKIKTGAVRTTAKKETTQANGISKPQGKTATVSGTTLKVTVHIPDTVQRRQEKINKIYDILKPKPAASAATAVSKEAV